MPYDFTKFELLNYDPKTLLNYPLLNFKDEYDVATRETTGKYTATYRHLIITIYKNRITIEGSLHKYWNAKHNNIAPVYIEKGIPDKGFNGNDFGLYHLYEVLDDLQKDFAIDPEQTKLLKLEYGVNLQLLYNPNKILNNVILHNGRQPDGSYNGYYKKFKHQICSLKVYNKGIQYLMDANIIRIEASHHNRKDFNKLGVHSLSDLVNPAVLDRLLNDLVKRWEKVLMYDFSIDSTQLSKMQKEQLKCFANPVSSGC